MAETVKAIGSYHGGIVHSIRAIAEVVGELSRLTVNMETEDWINSVFATGRGLHINY